MHYDLGLLLIVVVAVHLALHWGYIKCLPGRLKRRLMRTEAPKCDTWEVYYSKTVTKITTTASQPKQHAPIQHAHEQLA